MVTRNASVYVAFQLVTQSAFQLVTRNASVGIAWQLSTLHGCRHCLSKKAAVGLGMQTLPCINANWSLDQIAENVCIACHLLIQYCMSMCVVKHANTAVVVECRGNLPTLASFARCRYRFIVQLMAKHADTYLGAECNIHAPAMHASGLGNQAGQ